MADSRSVTSGFYLMVTGQIDACQMQGADNLYVKYSFNKGHDWSVLAGVEHGVSQIAKRSSGGVTDTLVWNYPLDIMFRSSNVHGWPQVVLGVYGLTAFGGDVVRGYGCTHVPTHPGRYVRYVQLYTPVSSSLCQRITAWVTNNPPEFFDSKFIAQGKGREVTRVRSHGVVKVTFNVTTKNMAEWGYQVSNERSNNFNGNLTNADALPLHMQQQPPPQLQPSPYEGSRPASAGNAFGGGGGLSSRSNGADSARSAAGGQSSVPPRTQLSAATTANMMAASSRRMSGTNNAGNMSSASVAPAPLAGGAAMGIAPPSQANSREGSRRDLFAGQQQQPTAAFAAAPASSAAAASSSSYSNFPSSSSSQQQPQQFQQQGGGNGGFDSSMDEFEGKYPSGGGGGGGGGGGFDRQQAPSSTLSQRGSLSRPTDMQPMQMQGMQGMGLAPLRSGGGRQLPPM